MDTSSFSQALSAVKPAVGNQRPFVQLEVTDKGLLVSADDMSTGISALIDAEVGLAAESTNGKVLVAHGPLAQFVSKCDSMFAELESDDDTLTVWDEDASMSMSVTDGGWFPSRPQPKGDLSAKLTGDEWERVLSLVPFAATASSKGPLQGIEFSPEGAAATDTYRLARWAHAFGFTAIIPAGIVSAIGSSDRVDVAGDSHSMRLTSGGITVTSSTLAGAYPDWRKNVKIAKTGQIAANSSALSKALDRCTINSREGVDGGRDVRVHPGGGSLRIESWPDDKGDSRNIVTQTIDASVETVDYPFGISAKYVTEMLAFLGKPDELVLDMGGPLRPATAEVDEMFGLLLPIRVSG